MNAAGALEHFHFLRPLWLALLPPFWLLAWRYLRARRQGGAWARICDEALLPFVVDARGAGRTRLAGTAAVLAGSIAIVAAAGPVWERLPVPVFRGMSALVIALDLSNSMNAADVQPSRLERAKFRIEDVLRLRKTGQTAIVVFAGHSFVVTPLTDDTETLAAQLKVLDTSIMPSQGSDPAAAIVQADRLLQQAGVPRGHILLVTDGAGGDTLKRAREALEGTSHRLSVLGAGTPDGAPIPDRAGGFIKAANGEIAISKVDEDALRAFAASGNGLYLDVSADDAELARLNDLLDSDLDAGVQRLEDLASNQWQEVGPWLLLPLLPLAALGFRRGVLLALVALTLPLGPRPAAAGWWQTEDQIAQRAFEEGDYRAAARAFEHPAWRGAAEYRAGDFGAAADSLAAIDTAEGHYNRGNALARLGRLEEALAAYGQALERQPEHEDAAYNKALIEELMKQEQPPEQRNQSDKDDSDGESGDGQSSQQQGGRQGGDSQSAQESGGETREDDDEARDAGATTASEEQREEAAQPPQQAEQASERERAGEQRDPAQIAEARSESDAERAQATEQWLRQIPDDPGGLLRRKFQYQYKKLYGSEPQRGENW